MKKKSKFELAFAEPVMFSDNTLVLNGDYMIGEAVKLFSEYIGQNVSMIDLARDFIRFGFQHTDDGENRACWYSNAAGGAGSCDAWILQLKN